MAQQQVDLAPQQALAVRDVGERRQERVERQGPPEVRDGPVLPALLLAELCARSAAAARQSAGSRVNASARAVAAARAKRGRRPSERRSRAGTGADRGRRRRRRFPGPSPGPPRGGRGGNVGGRTPEGLGKGLLGGAQGPQGGRVAPRGRLEALPARPERLRRALPVRQPLRRPRRVLHRQPPRLLPLLRPGFFEPRLCPRHPAPPPGCPWLSEAAAACRVECFRRVKTGGRGARAGAEIWGNARSPGLNASRGTPDAVNSGPSPPRRAALAPAAHPPETLHWSVNDSSVKTPRRRSGRATGPRWAPPSWSPASWGSPPASGWTAWSRQVRAEEGRDRHGGE